MFVRPCRGVQEFVYFKNAPRMVRIISSFWEKVKEKFPCSASRILVCRIVSDVLKKHEIRRIVPARGKESSIS